ncbi:MAG: D-aminoacyl-tRNA deacylase [Capnocytophaga sp.]|nr:D-aminoacyl-tRNA deacylase [Capnocytophaga sp.]
MRAIIQRVSQASLTIEQNIYSQIEKGLVVLLGIEDTDTQEDIEWLANKILKMRIFDDNQGVMNLSVEDIQGEIMIVSQFTLHASTKKGNRPSYIRAAKPEVSIPIYEQFILFIKKNFNEKIKTGVFGADMKINLTNDGPVTIFIDTKNKE